MYKKIMVGVDGSEHGANALREAVLLAHEFKADLHVFHAINHHYYAPLFPLGYTVPNPAYLYSAPYSEEKFRSVFEDLGRKIIEQAKQQFATMKVPLDGEVSFELEANVPPAEYVKMYAKENGVDLVVVGCEGHHSRARAAFMGTVAMSIVNSAPCEVLVVR